MNSISNNVLYKAIDIWKKGERSLTDTQSLKPKDNDPNPLWARANSILTERLTQGIISLDMDKILSTNRGVQSSMGKSSERLLTVIGKAVVEENKVDSGDKVPKLIGIKTGEEFSLEINNLRKTVRKGDDISDIINNVAKNFLVKAPFVDEIIHSAGKTRTYPDSVSLFSDGRLIVCEHKLSGRNDTKSVDKNLEVLYGFTYAFQRLNIKVETAIVHPFTHTSGWTKNLWVGKPLSPNWVVVNGEAWPLLFGVEITNDQYLYTVEAMAQEAARRMLIGIMDY